MSTKGLEEALTLFEDHIKACGPCDHAVNICVCGERSSLVVAREELKAIRKAASDLTRLNVGDFVYRIRDRAAEDNAFKGNTWEHPSVKAFSDASVLLGAIAKEDGTC